MFMATPVVIKIYFVVLRESDPHPPPFCVEAQEKECTAKYAIASTQLKLIGRLHSLFFAKYTDG